MVVVERPAVVDASTDTPVATGTVYMFHSVMPMFYNQPMLFNIKANKHV